MTLDFLCSDSWMCWYVSGHVPFDQFSEALASTEDAWDRAKFDPPVHSYFRARPHPEERGNTWYDVVKGPARGAFPVTFVARNW